MNIFNFLKKEKKEKFIGLYSIIYQFKEGGTRTYNGKFIIEKEEDIANHLNSWEHMYRRDREGLLCLLSNEKNERVLVERSSIETITIKFIKKMGQEEYFKTKRNK